MEAPRSPLASRPVVIWNPVAGRGRGAACKNLVEKAGWELQPTTQAGEAGLLAQRAIEAGARTIVAAGGDGTLGEVTGALLNTPPTQRASLSLGVLPIGTGNDFARTLDVWGDFERAISTIEANQVRQVDVGWLSVTTSDGQSPEKAFLNVAGCGFDALVARRINTWRNHALLRHIKDASAYFLGVLRELTTFKTTALRLELDGRIVETHGVLCAIGNAPSYGGGMKVCPDALIDDGLLDVCIIGDVGRLEFLRAFPGVFSGQHVKHPKVQTFRAARIAIESDTPLPVLCDGELVGTTPLKARVESRALRFLAPASN